MGLTYWKGEDLQKDSEEKAIYCKFCTKRAAHRDTQCCGFHHKFTDEELKVNRRSMKCITSSIGSDDKKVYNTLELYGPHPKDFNARSNYWLLPMK